MKYIFRVMLLLCAFVASLNATTYTLGGVGTTLGELKITLNDAGTMKVDRNISGTWDKQYYSTSGGGYMVINYDGLGTPLIQGKSTTFGGTSPYAEGTISNGYFKEWKNGTADNNITLRYELEYTSPNQYFKHKWSITNNSGSTKNDVVFIRGVDTYLSGGDSGAGTWNANTNTVGVKKVVDGKEQTLTLKGITTPSGYSSKGYNLIQADAYSGDLKNDLNTNSSTDNGYGMEWNTTSIANSETWSITAYESFTFSSLEVNAPVKKQCYIGTTCTLSFSVKNIHATDSDTITLSKSNSKNWSSTLDQTSSFVLATAETKTVEYNITIPHNSTVGEQSELFLTATGLSNSQMAIGLVEAYDDPSVNAEPVFADGEVTNIMVAQAPVEYTISIGATDSDTDANNLVWSISDSYFGNTSIDKNTSTTNETNATYKYTSTNGTYKTDKITITLTDPSDSSKAELTINLTRLDDVGVSTGTFDATPTVISGTNIYTVPLDDTDSNNVDVNISTSQSGVTSVKQTNYVETKKDDVSNSDGTTSNFNIKVYNNGQSESLIKNIAANGDEKISTIKMMSLGGQISFDDKNITASVKDSNITARVDSNGTVTSTIESGGKVTTVSTLADETTKINGVDATIQSSIVTIDASNNVETVVEVKKSDGTILKAITTTSSDGTVIVKVVTENSTTGVISTPIKIFADTSPYPVGSSVKIENIDGELYIKSNMPITSNMKVQ
ncbi:MAG: hypothetical protein GQ570_01305 [Helicobacteraceae bacterium]|nr:hypothetical protein [Helicobacteraceae bacterium]